MALTPSSMLPLGTPAPDFHLPDVHDGTTRHLADFDRRVLLVVFLCAHCPYVHHVSPELARLSAELQNSEVSIVGITSNDVEEYPQDAPQPTAEFAAKAGWKFPILFDETQAVARAYRAECTPDFFLYGPDRKLVYRGRIDGSRPNRGSDRPGEGQLNGADLRAAIQAVLSGTEVSPQQFSSLGCNIKWKAA